MNLDKVFFVTGAAGFTGRAVVRQLRSQGYKVKGLVRKESDSASVRELGAEAVVGDITNIDSFQNALVGVDGIFHIAALFRKAGLPDSEFHAVNVDGVRNVFEAAINAKVPRIIHCSTVGVLGHISGPPADETTAYNPGDIYQETKMQGELIALDYFRSGKIAGSVIRPAMIYGPGDTRTLKLFKMIANGTFFYIGEGNGLVHFVDVRDLARAFQSAMERSDKNGEIYIVAGDKSMPLKALVGLIAHELNVSQNFPHLPISMMKVLGSLCVATCRPFGVEPPLFPRRVDFFTKDRSFRTDKARTDLDFRPSQSALDEVSQIIDHYELDGLLRRKAASLSTRIRRSVEGDIQEWDFAAERLYGFAPKDAVGHVTHSLLKTRFPKPLNAINDELLRYGIWSGSLRHKRRDGIEVKVSSLWTLEQDRVVEINRSQVGSSNPWIGSLMQNFASLSATAGAIIPQLDFLAALA